MKRGDTLPYIHFTEAQRQQAATVDLPAFLRSRGETLQPSGRDLRLDSDHSVTVRGSEWYDHAAQRGGGPVSFVRQHYDLSYPEAMRLLLGSGIASCQTVKQETAPPKPFALPPAHTDMRRVYAYLMRQRNIDGRVVGAFAKAGLLYEDADHHNCVFVGKDEQGIARHAHKRSTNSFGKSFRLNVDGSDPRYSFHHIGTSGCLYVFEAPIDMLSYITLHPDNWQQHSYVACCGVSFQPVQQMLHWPAVSGSIPVVTSAAAHTATPAVPSTAAPDTVKQTDTSNPRYNTVFLCLDNDNAGRVASERMTKLLAEQGVCAQRLTPQNKDWNDDLFALRFRQRQDMLASAAPSPNSCQAATAASEQNPNHPNPSPNESEVTPLCQTFGF